MRLQSLLTLVPFYLALVASAAAAPTNSTNTTSPIVLDAQTDAFINKVLADWKSPGGVAIAFVRRNDQGQWVNIETKGYGRATYAGAPVTKDTTFNIGSNSKLFNAVAVGLLVNNQSLTPRLSWNSKVRDFIPGFNVTDAVVNKEADLIDLLSHRTGYPRHEFSYRYSDTVPDLIRKMQYQRQSNEFRDIWQYNNNMYTVLSQLPPATTGQNFARYVKQYIFDPLNLTATTYSYQLANSNGQRADGMARQGIDYYNGDPWTGIPRNVTYWSAKTGGEDGSVVAGSGGVISSAVDMAKWLQTLLLNGRNPVTNATVIPPNVFPRLAQAVIVQSPVPAFPEESGIVYGAAQVQITYRGNLVIEHPGFIRGFNTQVSRLPNSNFGVAVLTNDHDYGRTTSQIIKYYIMDRALGLAPIDWNSRFLQRRLTPPVAATPRPGNPALPSLNFTSYAGTYTSPGYGQFELCLVQPVDPNATFTCQVLARSAPTILPGAIRPGIPTYFGAFDSPWFSHMRMEHFDGNRFNISLLISTPTGNASEPYWTFNDRSESDNEQVSETEVTNGTIGLGMAGLWSGVWDGVPGATPKPQGNTTKARAEFYFDKLY